MQNSFSGVKTGKELPYCCESHQQFYEHVSALFAKFPNCCAAHQEIAKNPLVKIENYKSVPDKIIKQCAYTQHHIFDKINTDDWWADITEYIEYNNFSFGHPNIGLEHYLNYTLDSLENKVWLSDNKIPQEKAKKLAEFIRNSRSPNPKKEEDTSLTILFEIAVIKRKNF